jgi:hypothetical protein
MKMLKGWTGFSFFWNLDLFFSRKRNDSSFACHCFMGQVKKSLMTMVKSFDDDASASILVQLPGDYVSLGEGC